MKNTILLIAFAIISLSTIAQTDIRPNFNPIGNKILFSIKENGNNFYALQLIKPQSNYYQRRYNMLKFDKFSYTLIASKWLFGDTSLLSDTNTRVQEDFQMIIYQNKINLVFLRNFGYEELIQLDTNLQITVPEKTINNCYTDSVIKFISHQSFIRIDSVLYVNEITGTGNRPALIQLDLNGNVIRKDTLSKGKTNNTYDILVDLYKINNNRYLGSGQDFVPGYGNGFELLDSNFNLIDTFQKEDFKYNGNPVYFGRYFVTQQLPTGSLIGAGIGQSGFMTYMMKFDVTNRYSTKKIIKFGSVDQNDSSHRMTGIYLLQYQPYDNLIYCAFSTHMDIDDRCTNNYNYIQVVCTDTNLNTKFNKFIYSDTGCLFSSQLINCYDRSGVLLLAGNSKKDAYLFKIDSATPTSINTPSGLSIRNRLEILPNPASSFFQISDIFNQAGIYSIINLMGQTVRSGSYDAINNKIEVTDLPTGNYLIHLQTKDGEMQNVKVLKE